MVAMPAMMQPQGISMMQGQDPNQAYRMIEGLASQMSQHVSSHLQGVATELSTKVDKLKSELESSFQQKNGVARG